MVRQRRLIWLLLICVVLLAACLLGVAYFDAALQAITPDEIVGAWRADYAGRRNFDGDVLSGVETLTIRPDGTYQQTFEDAQSGYFYRSEWNHWRWDARGSIVGFLYLESGRSYVFGTATAEQAARQSGDCSHYVGIVDDPWSQVELPCVDAIVEVQNDFWLRPGPRAITLKVMVNYQGGDPDALPEYIKFYRLTR